MSGSIDFKPAFQVEKVSGTFTRNVMHIEEDVREVGPLKNKQIIARNIVRKQETFTEGYMLYFPQGHSIFIAADDEKQLNRLGVFGRPQVVDMNSGEVVPDTFAMTPKEIVENKQRNRPRAASQGGLATLEGEKIE